MVRIIGVDIPKEKRIDIGLTYVYGIGRNNAIEILKKSNIDPSIRGKNLNEEQLGLLSNVIEDGYIVEGDLRKEKQLNIKRLMDINSFRGHKHRKKKLKGKPIKNKQKVKKG